MNAPTIRYEQPDRRHIAACPLVPEFKFSPKVTWFGGPGLAATPPAPRPPRFIGPMLPPMLSNPRKVHEPITRDSREIEWMNLRPLSAKRTPIKQQGFVAPLGGLEGMDRFEARVQAIMRLTNQQERDRATNRAIVEADKELPFIIDEFKANGFRAISLSSSQSTTDDDEMDAANFAEKHLGTVPYAFGQNGVQRVPISDELRFLSSMFGIEAPEFIEYPTYNNLEELPGIVRRIEWERNESRNGPLIRVILCAGPDDTLSATVAQPWMMKHVTIDDIKTLGKRMKRECRYKTFSQLDEIRAKAEYYGIGSAIYKVWHGEKFPEQSMNELGAEDLTVPKRERALPPERRSAALVAQGEQELGIHGGANDEVLASLPWKDYIHEKDEYPRQGDTLMLGYGVTLVNGRETDDPLSKGSRLWKSARNGRRWVAPWPELLTLNA